MATFNPQLTEPNVPSSSGGGGGNTGVILQAVAGAGSTAVSIAGLLKQGRDSEAKNVLQGGLDTLQTQTEAFNQEANRITQGLEGARDTQVAANLHKDMARLVRGQSQFGSRRNLTAKAQILVRKFAARNPHLTKEAEAMFNASTFGMGNVENEAVAALESEIIKEQEAVTSIQVRYDLNREDAQVQYNNLQTAQITALNAKLAVDQAAKLKSDLSSSGLLSAQAESALSSTSMTALALDRFKLDPNDANVINDVKVQFGIERQKFFASFAQKQLAANTPVGGKSIKEIEAVWDARQKNLADILGSADPVAGLKANQKLQASLDTQFLNNVSRSFNNKVFAAALRADPGENAKFLRAFTTNIASVGKLGKTRNQLALMLDNATALGNVELQAALSAILAGNADMWLKGIVDANGRVKLDGSTTDEVNSYASSSMFATSLDPVDVKYNKMVTSSALEGESLSNIQNLRTRVATGKILSSPELRTHVSNLVNTQADDIVNIIKDLFQDSQVKDFSIGIDDKAFASGLSSKEVSQLFKIRSDIEGNFQTRSQWSVGLKNKASAGQAGAARVEKMLLRLSALAQLQADISPDKTPQALKESFESTLGKIWGEAQKRTEAERKSKTKGNE
jgi:hypothetical protein